MRKENLGLLALLCLSCLASTALASGSVGFDRVEADGEWTQRGDTVNVLSGDLLEITVVAGGGDEDWTIAQGKTSELYSLKNCSYDYPHRRCTLWVQISPDHSGRIEMQLLMDNDGAYAAQYPLRLRVTHPSELEPSIEFCGLDQPLAQNDIPLYAETGLSEAQADELELTYEWYIHDRRDFEKTVTGNDRSIDLTEGSYDVTLTITDRLGRAFSQTTRIDVLDTEPGDVRIDYSHSDDTSRTGDNYLIDLAGTYSDQDMKLWIYVDGTLLATLPYQAGKVRPLQAETQFDTPGTKTITIVAREEFSEGEKVSSRDGELKRTKYTVFVEDEPSGDAEPGSGTAGTAKPLGHTPAQPTPAPHENPFPWEAALVLLVIFLLIFVF